MDTLEYRLSDRSTQEMPMRCVSHVLGIPIDRLTQTSFLIRLERFIATGTTHIVLYANADGMNQAVRDRRYARILQEADLVCADGMGVVWASKLTSKPLTERVNVGDMMAPFCALAAQKGYRLFFLGGAPEVAEQAAVRCRRQFPGLQIVGTHHGYFALNESDAVIKQINRGRPHVLLVGMGVPRQEKWIWQHRDTLHVPVLWGVGALFDYYAGKTPRAPVWMRRLGLEWCFRLMVEPRRLWQRYLVGNAFFVLRTCTLLLIDALLVTAAWLGAYWTWRGLDRSFGFTLNPIEPYLTTVPLIVGIWLVTCASFGLYRRSTGMAALSELAQVIRATGVGMLSTLAVAFLLRELSFGRPVVILSGALTFVLLSMSRLATRRVEQQLAQRGIGLRRALIVGTGPLAQRVRTEIETWPIGYDVLGFVRDGDTPTGSLHGEVLGSINELGPLISQHSIQDVFVASDHLQLHQELNLLVSHERWPVNFHLISKELEEFAQRVPLSRVVELPLLDLPWSRPTGWYEFTKRVFDVMGAAFGTLCLFPLAIVIAVLITCESSGPVLFVQERVGRGGRRFMMYKFRTMFAEAPAYEVAPNDLTDPRVTRFGRFLRRWSLDELPQLLNVLRGQMSLVGPRPEMPFLVEQYQPWQQWRLAVTSGLTCLWQVVGRKELPLHHNLEYDLYYVRHRGWLLDLTILLRTIPAVLCRRGAF